MKVWKLGPGYRTWHWTFGPVSRYTLCGFNLVTASQDDDPENAVETNRCRANGCRQKWVEWDERRQRNQVRTVDSQAGRAVALPAGRIEGRPSHGSEADRGRDLERRGSSDRTAGVHAGKAGSGAVQERTAPAGFLAGINLDLSLMGNAFIQLRDTLVNYHPITITWDGVEGLPSYNSSTASGSYGQVKVSSPLPAKCACGEPRNRRWEHSELECSWLERD